MKTKITTSPCPLQRGTSEGARQRGTILRDKTLDWFDRLMSCPWLERGCWAYIAISVIYFGLIALNVLVR